VSVQGLPWSDDLKQSVNALSVLASREPRTLRLVEPMNTPATRLKAARFAAGFKSALYAARHFGLTPATYLAHENGQNKFSAEEAKEYASNFGTTAEWLLHGKADSISLHFEKKQVEIDPLLVETWQKLTPKQRRRLAQIALIIAEE
jgi:hypothetical protein